MQAAIYQIVTFATEIFAGNPAFVLRIPEPLPADVLQRVAGQLNEGVLSSLRWLDDGRAALAFHTPARPHGGAGHSAAAAAHVFLEETGRERGIFVLPDGSERVVVREAGRIDVPWPVMPFAEAGMAAPLARALGVPVRAALDSDFGYVAVCDDPAAVAAIRPDLDAIAAFERGTVIVTAPGTHSDIVIRVFAPKLGLPEDPVCGTAHRIIVPYWSAVLGRTALHSRQLSPRGGDLWCRLEADSVVIGGQSRAFLTGAVDLPRAT